MPLKSRITVAAVLEQDGRFLMVEELIDGRSLLNQPAGHLEDAESVAAAVVREVREETAWEFDPQALVGIYRWRQVDSGDTFFRFCFTGRLLRHHAGQALDPDITRTLWLTAGQLAGAAGRHRSPLVSRCLGDYLKGCRYPLDILSDL
jgi:8-oxo-dGTP pyrophosphatase MutT (NUDIX family)